LNPEIRDPEGRYTEEAVRNIESWGYKGLRPDEKPPPHPQKTVAQQVAEAAINQQTNYKSYLQTQELIRKYLGMK